MKTVIIPHRTSLIIMMFLTFILNFLQVDIAGQVLFMSNILIIFISLFYVSKIVSYIWVLGWFYFLFLAIFSTTIISRFDTFTLSSALSLLLPMSMILIGLVTFSILAKAKESTQAITTLIYKFGVVTAIFSLIQFVFYNVFALPLALSEVQVGQIEVNRMPGFSYESDVNGKLLGFFLVFLLPFYLFKPAQYKGIYFILIAFIIVQTRTAILALFLCVFFMLLFFSIKLIAYKYKPKLELARFLNFTLWVVIISTLALFIFIAIGNSYIIDRFSNMFSVQATTSSDVSYLFRITDILLTVENILDDRFNWVIGEGWGSKLFIQRSFLGADIEDPTGSLILFLLYYGGLTITAIFFYYPFKLMITSFRLYMKFNSYFYLSIFLSILYMLSVSMLGSLWNKCIFWFFLGLSAYYIRYYKTYILEN